MKKKLLIKSIALAIVVIALVCGFMAEIHWAFEVSGELGIIVSFSPLLLGFFCFLVYDIYTALDDDIH